MYQRSTTSTPSARPPALQCPKCQGSLTYQHSHIGGVSSRHAEQWDRYACPACGGWFEYRQRTRKLRRVN
jgi:hypothetical protein